MSFVLLPHQFYPSLSATYLPPSTAQPHNWTIQEDFLLICAVEQFLENWGYISYHFGGRISPQDCQFRYNFLKTRPLIPDENVNVNKTWTEEEDRLLMISYKIYHKHTYCWNLISRFYFPHTSTASCLRRFTTLMNQIPLPQPGTIGRSEIPPHPLSQLQSETWHSSAFQPLPGPQLHPEAHSSAFQPLPGPQLQPEAHSSALHPQQEYQHQPETWSQAEIRFLALSIKQFGNTNWMGISQTAFGNLRSASECREYYLNNRELIDAIVLEIKQVTSPVQTRVPSPVESRVLSSNSASAQPLFPSRIPTPVPSLPPSPPSIINDPFLINGLNFRPDEVPTGETTEVFADLEETHTFFGDLLFLQRPESRTSMGSPQGNNYPEQGNFAKEIKEPEISNNTSEKILGNEAEKPNTSPLSQSRLRLPNGQEPEVLFESDSSGEGEEEQDASHLSPDRLLYSSGEEYESTSESDSSYEGAKKTKTSNSSSNPQTQPFHWNDLRRLRLVAAKNKDLSFEKISKTTFEGAVTAEECQREFSRLHREEYSITDFEDPEMTSDSLGDVIENEESSTNSSRASSSATTDITRQKIHWEDEEIELLKRLYLKHRVEHQGTWSGLYKEFSKNNKTFRTQKALTLRVHILQTQGLLPQIEKDNTARSSSHYPPKPPLKKNITAKSSLYNTQTSNPYLDLTNRIWTNENYEKLTSAYESADHTNDVWSRISSQLKIPGSSPRLCKDQWNYLVDRTSWTKEEDQTLLEGLKIHDAASLSDLVFAGKKSPLDCRVRAFVLRDKIKIPTPTAPPQETTPATSLATPPHRQIAPKTTPEKTPSPIPASPLQDTDEIPIIAPQPLTLVRDLDDPQQAVSSSPKQTTPDPVIQRSSAPVPFGARLPDFESLVPSVSQTIKETSSVTSQLQEPNPAIVRDTRSPDSPQPSSPHLDTAIAKPTTALSSTSPKVAAYRRISVDSLLTNSTDSKPQDNSLTLEALSNAASMEILSLNALRSFSPPFDFGSPQSETNEDSEESESKSESVNTPSSLFSETDPDRTISDKNLTTEWSRDEDKQLTDLVAKYGEYWNFTSFYMGISIEACKTRYSVISSNLLNSRRSANHAQQTHFIQRPRRDYRELDLQKPVEAQPNKTGEKRKYERWTQPEEDELKQLVQDHGKSWALIASKLTIKKRDPKSCASHFKWMSAAKQILPEAVEEAGDELILDLDSEIWEKEDDEKLLEGYSHFKDEYKIYALISQETFKGTKTPGMVKKRLNELKLI